MTEKFEKTVLVLATLLSCVIWITYAISKKVENKPVNLQKNYEESLNYQIDYNYLKILKTLE